MGVNSRFNKKLEGDQSLLHKGYSSGSSTPSPQQHVVVVMDGLIEFTTEPLKWALQNIITPGCVITLLGVMPWLNIPLSVKTWHDVWPMEFENLQDNNVEWKSDPKHLKLQAIIDLCKSYAAVPHKEVVMGYPCQLLVVEKITNLHATWVVFDRHMKKNREFYVERLRCNMVMMKEKGEADIIKTSHSYDGQ
ncbi:uncharacterized protein LOC116206378 [Punica granatum]|uniref:Uncharacterized protein LOC116206378 n=1 Tax=Punica granatum TaxID=22663 RepID=A0A218XTX4_PUNGR|nr:uncharacterized protein LOC116206378 [Punica granatum]OWM88280.1 hypothetical protein CDL15_Pgr003692 [Punica granatum]